jgi:hypothetical protein
MCPQGAVFEILFEVPLKKGKPLFLSRSALHGHEVGLNGPQDIDGSFIDIPLGVPRTSFPGHGPPVTGGRRRFPSKGWRQVLVEPPFCPMRSFLSLRISLNVVPPQLGGGGVVFPPSSSHQGQATPLLLPRGPIYLGIFLWSSPDPGIVPVLRLLVPAGSPEQLTPL